MAAITGQAERAIGGYPKKMNVKVVEVSTPLNLEIKNPQSNRDSQPQILHSLELLKP